MNVVEPYYDQDDIMVSLSLICKHNVAQHLRQNVSALATQLQRLKPQNSKIFSEINVAKQTHIILVNSNIIKQTTAVSNQHIGKIVFSLP